MLSYWCYFVGGVIMLASFFVPGGAAQSGWTSYPPLSDIATFGSDLVADGHDGADLLVAAGCDQLHHHHHPASEHKGLSFFRLPFFCWAQFVTAFLLLLAFPPLQAASFFLLHGPCLRHQLLHCPSGLVISGQLAEVSGGGSPLLWQHLFWFLAHPEVYVLILPAMGIVAEVIANNTRKPIWGYKSMVYSLIFLGFMSFIVWAHHMFITGMGRRCQPSSRRPR